MRRYSALLIGTIAIFAFLLPLKSASSPPATGPPCTVRAHVVEALRGAYGEFLVGRGLSSDGRLIELYAAQTGTFTLIATSPTGTSCLVATGEAWELVRSEIAER